MGMTKRLGYAETIEYYMPSLRPLYRGLRAERLAEDQTVRVIANIFGWEPIDVALSFQRRWAAETPVDLLRTK